VACQVAREIERQAMDGVAFRHELMM
jgi:hypothetical protein